MKRYKMAEIWFIDLTPALPNIRDRSSEGEGVVIGDVFLGGVFLGGVFQFVKHIASSCLLAMTGSGNASYDGENDIF